MIRSRTDKILNLLSSTMVLLAGFYVLIFIPLRIPGFTRVILGVLLVIYFLWRVKYVYKGQKKTEDPLGRDTAGNK